MVRVVGLNFRRRDISVTGRDSQVLQEAAAASHPSMEQLKAVSRKKDDVCQRHPNATAWPLLPHKFTSHPYTTHEKRLQAQLIFFPDFQLPGLSSCMLGEPEPRLDCRRRHESLARSARVCPLPCRPFFFTERPVWPFCQWSVYLVSAARGLQEPPLLARMNENGYGNSRMPYLTDSACLWYISSLARLSGRRAVGHRKSFRSLAVAVRLLQFRLLLCSVHGPHPN